MKRALFIVILLLFPSGTFAQSPATKLQSKTANKRHLELRVKPFIDLYFFVYKLSSGSEKAPDIDGFAQAVEAARQIPFSLTLIDLIPFQCENAAELEKAFSRFPETDKTKKGEIISKE